MISSIRSPSLLSLSAWIAILLAAPRNVYAACDCYAPSNNPNQLVQNFDIYDWTSISGISSQGTTDPAYLTSTLNPTNVSRDSYINSGSFATNWDVTARVSDVTFVYPTQFAYSGTAVFVSRDSYGSTYITLRCHSSGSFVSGAEISRGNNSILYGSFTALMRIDPNNASPGATAAFFVYRSDTEEADAQILTSDSTTIMHDTNQASNSYRVTLPGGAKWTDWHYHRFDWYNGSLSWYLDETLVTSDSTNIPSHGANIYFNTWSNGDSWTGNMATGGNVRLEIAGMSMAYNTTSSPATTWPSNCRSVCLVKYGTIDSTSTRTAVSSTSTRSSSRTTTTTRT